jgi:hypothetical protein
VGSAEYRVPSIASIGTQVIVPVNAGGDGDGERIACFDHATGAGCAGSWPATIAPGYVENHGAAFPTLT